MDADPKPHATRLVDLRVALAERGLDCHRRLDRLGRELEDREHRISGRVDHTAAGLVDALAEDGARGVERLDGGPGVVLHEPGVAGDVGRQHRRQSALDLGHPARQ